MKFTVIMERDGDGDVSLCSDEVVEKNQNA
jgi:hypothetical protein